MPFTKLKYALVAVVLVTGLGGFALGQFQRKPAPEKTLPPPPVASGLPATPTAPAVAEDPKPATPFAPLAVDNKPVRAADAPAATPRRREAVIKVPVGTYVKNMDVGDYGAGRLTWTFEEDRVLGIIEASVMGVEIEIRTEAEFSLSRNGTIYGIVTSVEVTHMKFGLVGELGEIGTYLKFLKLAEPLLVEMLTDLPFSYQFRISGDKLTILNYRALLAGPNPLGKLGGLVGLSGGNEGLAVLSGFQALALAIEGTYTAAEAEPREKKTRPIIRRPTKN
jgi:hypothetical protein